MRILQVGFAFTINLPARVNATLTRRVRVRGHIRWRALRSLTFAAASGINRARLAGHAILPPGVYRLTLASASGASRSVLFRVR
jgi:hypothetical protein